MTHSSALSAVAASVLVVLLVFLVLQLLPLLWPRAMAAKISQIAKTRRQWHPRSPEDCSQCSAWIPPAPATLVEVVPWNACRIPRGAKKRLSSEGVACSNAQCTYFGCTVESVHAMVSCGVRGKTDKIRRWKCQACGASVSERKHTPLYHLKTPPSRICLVMSLLANGLDPSAAPRIFRHDHRTISRLTLGCRGWLTRGGTHASALHDLFFRRLHCAFLQRDELVANIRGDELIAPLARRTWSIARSQESLLAIPHSGLCCYHFIRPLPQLAPVARACANAGDGCAIDRSHLVNRGGTALQDQVRLTEKSVSAA